MLQRLLSLLMILLKNLFKKKSTPIEEIPVEVPEDVQGEPIVVEPIPEPEREVKPVEELKTPEVRKEEPVKEDDKVMNFKVIRKHFMDKEILGELYIDGEFYCYTLEDVYRDRKVKGRTCIPYGEYTVLLTYSTKFKTNVPLIFNNSRTWEVENKFGDKWGGIRIHDGYTNTWTEGCILIGEKMHLNKKRVGSPNEDGTPVYNWLEGGKSKDFWALFGRDMKTRHTLTIEKA